MTAKSVQMACVTVVVLVAGVVVDLSSLPAQEGVAKRPLTAASYYVDFAAGRDDNDGRSPGSAFKHCPGDTEATGNAGTVKLSAGDKVIFKGGVDYRGTVTVAWSGNEGQPIVYDGNTDGKFGAGKAIIQGGEPVTGWTKVASAKDVEQNPHWRNLYSTYLDGNRTFFNFSLFEGDDYLAAAQDPKQDDPFFFDRVGLPLGQAESDRARPQAASVDNRRGSYRNTKTDDDKSLTDPAYFTSPDPDDYAGAYLALHIQPNYICCQPITGYDPAAHKVTFKPHGQRRYSSRQGQNYALMNSLKILSRPGEYYLDEKNAKEGKVRLVVWPHRTGANGPENVTISTRAHGFLIPSASHIVIDGFKICQHGGHPRSAGIWKPPGPDSTGLVIRNNEVYRGWPTPMVNITALVDIQGAITLRHVSHCLVENNSVYDNRRLGILGVAFNDSVCQYNYLRRNGSTAASFHTCKQSKILYNVIWDNLGIHANGVSAYLGSDGMLIEGNEVYNSNDCFTTGASSNITVRRNIFDAHGLEAPIAIWTGRPVKNVTIENNVLLRASRGWKAGIYESAGAENCIIRNNIIDGVACTRRGIRGEMSHNLWTSKGRDFQGEKPGDIFESDLRKIFMDPDHHDYRLRPGSPAIDAGVETESKQDIAGTSAPQGPRPDIGAYEFVPNGPQYRKGHAGRLAPSIRPSPPATVPSH